jgi:hypothetical protein
LRREDFEEREIFDITPIGKQVESGVLKAVVVDLPVPRGKGLVVYSGV